MPKSTDEHTHLPSENVHKHFSAFVEEVRAGGHNMDCALSSMTTTFLVNTLVARGVPLTPRNLYEEAVNIAKIASELLEADEYILGDRVGG